MRKLNSSGTLAVKRSPIIRPSHYRKYRYPEVLEIGTPEWFKKIRKTE
jgi:hypothetical protein